MKALNLSLIKLTICLIIGIVIGYFFQVPLLYCLIIYGFIITIYSLWIWRTHNKLGNHILFNSFILATILFAGIASITIHNLKNKKQHYTNYLGSISDSIAIEFRVREILKPGNFYDKYVIDIIRFDSIQATGKILLNVAKDSTKSRFEVDENFFSITLINELVPPSNPYQFNYKDYLKKKYIYHQLYVTNEELLQLPRSQPSISGIAHTIRKFLIQKLEQKNFEPSELAVIKALLLGQRQDISKELYASYAQAGAIHILAISGLHVGIILLLLNWVFKPIELVPKGTYIKPLIIIAIMWSYAIIAGLSASVVRAVTMFSIFAVAINMKRPTNVYNTLAFSAFVLLLFKPLFIFDVGFQLSYLAVLAIVSFEPMLSSLWKPKLKPINFFWRTFTVTIAAQLGILPLSIFYFHQFPGLFFVSNLVVIPCLGFILATGILTILLAAINLLPDFLVSFLGSIISSLNNFIAWVANQEQYLFKYLSFDTIDVLFSYLIIVGFYWSFKTRSFRALSSTLIFILGFQTWFLVKKHTTNDAFIVFHKSRFSAIAQHKNDTLHLYHNLKRDTILNEYFVENYKVGSAVEFIKEYSLPDFFISDKERVLVIDSLGVYETKSFKPSTILLRNSPKINLDRLIDSIHPKLIISDGSNYKSYQKRWKATCLKRKIPFHSTSEKGAYIVLE